DPDGEPVPSEAGNLTTPGPINLQATLAAMVERGARGAAIEVSSHSLDQGRVDGLEFRAALFTNLTRDHLDYHKTLDAYFRAKAKLIQYLAPDGLEVVNADDPAWARLRREHRRVTFGERGGEVTARRVTLDAQGARFELGTPMGGAAVRLPLLGRFNVANALGVAARVSPISPSPRRTTPGPRTPRRSSTPWRPAWERSPTTARWTAAGPSRSGWSWRAPATRCCSLGRGTRPIRSSAPKRSRSMSGR